MRNSALISLKGLITIYQKKGFPDLPKENKVT